MTAWTKWGSTLLAAVLLAGCGTSGSSDVLSGTLWDLVAYGEAGDPTASLGSAMTNAQFTAKDGTLSGFGGCNTYGGHYTGLGSVLKVTEVQSDDGFCEEPEGVMEQESAYLDLLANAKAYQVENGRLMILSENRDVLIFQKREETTLTYDDNNSSVTLNKGAFLLLRLDSNPSTGFGWEINASAAPVLEQVGDSQYEAPETGAIGASGTELFRFKAADTGTATLKLLYRQPWAEGYARMFTVTVTVP